MITILEKDEITENDIQLLINTGAEESINLEFKSAESLSQNDKKKSEIAKDVSAFANSAGGFIVYGIREENHKASLLSPVDGTIFTKEWLEQVIQTRIQRKIEGLSIIPIRINNDIKTSLYIIKIPESSLAPHMTSDKKFYKRYNFESVQMEEYEIRNLYNRKDKTYLLIDNIITQLNNENEVTTDEKEAKYKNMKFQIINIGKSVEKDYKLLIKLNFSNYLLKWNPIRNDKNINHSFIDENSRIISFYGVSPIFPEETLTIGEIDFGLLFSEIDETLKFAEFHMTLLFTNGKDELNIKLSDIF